MAFRGYDGAGGQRIPMMGKQLLQMPTLMNNNMMRPSLGGITPTPINNMMRQPDQMSLLAQNAMKQQTGGYNPQLGGSSDGGYNPHVQTMAGGYQQAPQDASTNPIYQQQALMAQQQRASMTPEQIAAEQNFVPATPEENAARMATQAQQGYNSQLSAPQQQYGLSGSEAALQAGLQGAMGAQQSGTNAALQSLQAGNQIGQGQFDLGRHALMGGYQLANTQFGQGQPHF